MMDKIDPYWKALIAFIAPGAVTIGSAVTADSAGGTHITAAEWVTAAVACIVTSASVAAIPNGFIAKRKAAKAPEPLDGP